MEKKYNLKKGIAYILFSSLGFATMGICVRGAGDVPFVQKTLFRNIIALTIALAALIPAARKDPAVLKVPRPAMKYLILRITLGSLGIFGNFYAISKMNVSDAAMLNKMCPFFAILASILLLKEKPTTVSLASLVVAFCGSLLIIKPSFDIQKFGPALFGFIGGFGAGFAVACIRKMSTYNVNGILIIAVFSAFSTLLAVPSLIINYYPMSLQQLLWLLGAGVAAGCGQFGLTGAYFNAPASKISIYEYSNIVFSATMAFILFGQVPDRYSVAGYVIIIGTAITVFVINNRNSKNKDSVNS